MTIDHPRARLLHVHAAVLSLTLLGACGEETTPSANQPDATVPEPDAPQSSATCDQESFALQGAVNLTTASAGTVTIDGKIAGVAGSSGPNRLYSLNVRMYASDMLDRVGTYDIATHNLKFFDQPAGGCGNGPCTGFYAMGGTYEVLSVQPMYRATFTFTDLRERSDADSPPGAAIAGQITGCLAALPP
jgi:hypothetical protein